jgi:hypothetical protein
MASIPSIKMPEFHGDPMRFPGETWKSYKNKLELAYMGMGKPENITDKQRVAHMLQGLRGKAAKFYELTPNLIEKSSKEVNAILEKKFGKASIKELMAISQLIQKPSETVLEYVARLRAAAAYMNEERRDIRIVSKAELDALDEAEKRNVWTQEAYDKTVEDQERNTEEFVLLHFVRGLRETLRKEVYPKNCPTLEIAIREAEGYERYAEAFQDLRDIDINTLEGDLDFVHKEAGPAVQGWNSFSPVLSSQGYPPEQGGWSCHYCGCKGYCHTWGYVQPQVDYEDEPAELPMMPGEYPESDSDLSESYYMTSGKYSDEELEYSKSESGESESYYNMPGIDSDLAESGDPDFLVTA